MLSQYADRLKKMTTPDKEIIDEITLININRCLLFIRFINNYENFCHSILLKQFTR